MAWNEQWSYKVDGFELNDKVSYITQIPELETGSDDDVILVPVDGSPPSYIRNQPKEALYSLQVTVIDAGDWVTWNTRMNTLRGVLSKGQHTLTVQARGMATAASAKVVIRGMAVNVKQRSLVATAVVPTPIF